MSDDHRLSDPKTSKSRPVEETLIFSDGTHPESEAPSGKPPKKFGRYEIKRVLGEGAMGAVLLATDTQLQREVALKIPKFARDAAPQLFERFYLEARLAATLNHPNICPVFDVGEIDGTHYITMAYIEGHRLSDFIDPEKPQGERQISQVVRKLALALKEAHAKGVVHRDLKPANVMIDKRGEPVIMDFGIALQENAEDTRLTREGQLVGSPAYMSPEQMGGSSGKIGPATDIYSLGVVLYELLTGELPFEGTGSMASIIGEVLTKEPKDLNALRPGLDQRLAAICMKAMAREIDDRYESMGKLASALTKFLKEAQKTTVVSASPSSETKTEPISSQPIDSSLLADLDEALPPVNSSSASSGTVLSAPSKQPSWLLPTAIGLAVIIPALLIWALLRSSPAAAPTDDAPTSKESSENVDTEVNNATTPAAVKPAPPVASQETTSGVTPQQSPTTSDVSPSPRKIDAKPVGTSPTSLKENVILPSAIPADAGKQTSAEENQTEPPLSKTPSSSFSEDPKNARPDSAEKPPRPLDKRGPRIGPPPRPGGPLLPPGVSVDQLFRDLDKNRDNKLSPDELPAETKAHLFRADRNRDGYLVKKELRDAEERRDKRRPGKKPR